MSEVHWVSKANPAFSYLFHVRVAYDDALIRGLIIVFCKGYTIAEVFIKRRSGCKQLHTVYYFYLLNEQTICNQTLSV